MKAYTTSQQEYIKSFREHLRTLSIQESWEVLLEGLELVNERLDEMNGGLEKSREEWTNLANRLGFNPRN